MRCAHDTRVRTVQGVAVAWKPRNAGAPEDQPPRVFAGGTCAPCPAPQNPSPCPALRSLEPAGRGPQSRRRAATPEWLARRASAGRPAVACSRGPAPAPQGRTPSAGLGGLPGCRVFSEELLERWPPRCRHAGPDAATCAPSGACGRPRPGRCRPRRKAVGAGRPGCGRGAGR